MPKVNEKIFIGIVGFLSLVFIIFSFKFNHNVKQELKKIFENSKECRNILLRKDIYLQQQKTLQEDLKQQLTQVLISKTDEEAARNIMEKIDQIFKGMSELTLLSKSSTPAINISKNFYRIDIKLNLKGELKDFTEFMHLLLTKEKTLHIIDFEIMNKDHYMEYNMSLALIYKKD